MKPLDLNKTQSELLLMFLKEHVSKWSETKICNRLGLRKSFHKGIYWYLDEPLHKSIGTYWGNYIMIPTRLTDRHYSNNNYRYLQMRLFCVNDEWFLSTNIETNFYKSGDIKVPKKVVKSCGFV